MCCCDWWGRVVFVCSFVCIFCVLLSCWCMVLGIVLCCGRGRVLVVCYWFWCGRFVFERVFVLVWLFCEWDLLVERDWSIWYCCWWCGVWRWVGGIFFVLLVWDMGMFCCCVVGCCSVVCGVWFRCFWVGVFWFWSWWWCSWGWLFLRLLW